LIVGHRLESGSQTGTEVYLLPLERRDLVVLAVMTFGIAVSSLLVYGRGRDNVEPLVQTYLGWEEPPEAEEVFMPVER
jgi:hypothetical protein